MSRSLVFTPGCDWKIDRRILFVEYETVTGKPTSKRFDLSAETEYILDGYKTLSFDELSKPDSKLQYSIKKIVYFEKECNSMVAFARGCRQTRLFIPTRIEFDTVIHVPKENPDADSDRVKMINQRIARIAANSTYGMVSRDWADVLADSARYIHMQQSRCSGKTLWLSSATSFADKQPFWNLVNNRDICEQWLKTPPEPLQFISDDLEDCEKGVPNTKLIDPNEYFDTDMAMTREEMMMEAAERYCLNDVAVTEKIFKEEKIMRFDSCKPTIKKVIFNDPATIVFWTDGTKTIVKCGENDDFDPEKGIAMACMKKLLGTNKTGSNYIDKVKKYISKWEEDNPEENIWTKLFCELSKMTGEDLVNTDAMDIPEETENQETTEGGENNDEA